MINVKHNVITTEYFRNSPISFHQSICWYLLLLLLLLFLLYFLFTLLYLFSCIFEKTYWLNYTTHNSYAKYFIYGQIEGVKRDKKWATKTYSSLIKLFHFRHLAFISWVKYRNATHFVKCPCHSYCDVKLEREQNVVTWNEIGLYVSISSNVFHW